ncbi:hypothetical protein PIB30_082422 [Stylosanthes scabra]|uniref:Replication protein A 70 kDa DNA-binding subunit B/D first OB fold domain-containing protein n=1 Tax=Stylosanthes scabra TaxID=79078 RepID=A0ABU6SU65_9FABA|nr:hypothetical protein [Stylosanthes scabra]
MALTIDFFEDVGPKKLGLCFNVYLIRLWEEFDKINEEETNRVDMGIRVQGTVPKYLIKQWRDKLKEFKMYTMSNFIVADTRPMTRTFCKKTTVRLVEVPSFELHPFVMKDIPDLLHAESINPYIISEVVVKQEYKEVMTSKGIKTKRMAVTIKDIKLFGDNPSTTVRISQISSGSSVRYVDELTR